MNLTAESADSHVPMSVKIAAHGVSRYAGAQVGSEDTASDLDSQTLLMDSPRPIPCGRSTLAI